MNGFIAFLIVLIIIILLIWILLVVTHRHINWKYILGLKFLRKDHFIVC